MFVKYFVIASTILCCASALFGSMKNVTVIGRLYCGDVSEMDVVVELWEDDTVLGIGSDDRLDITATDYNGRFLLYGQKRELFNIEPYVLIKHHCGKMHCTIIDRRDIAKRFLGRTYDIGPLELSLEPKGGGNRAIHCPRFYI